MVLILIGNCEKACVTILLNGKKKKKLCDFDLFFCSDYLFKLLLIGDSGVGKSCLLLRFAVSFLYSWFLSLFQFHLNNM